jgi:hypothetical protein
VHWMKPRRPEPAVKPTAKSPKPASTEPVQASLLP